MSLLFGTSLLRIDSSSTVRLFFAPTGLPTLFGGFGASLTVSFCKKMGGWRKWRLLQAARITPAHDCAGAANVRPVLPNCQELFYRTLIILPHPHRDSGVDLCQPGDLVVAGEHLEGPEVVGRERQADDRDLVALQALRCQHHAVAGEDRPVAGHHHVAVEAVLLDRPLDVAELVLRVLAVVDGVRLQGSDRHPLDPLGGCDALS